MRKLTKLLLALPLTAAIALSCSTKEETKKEEVKVQGLDAPITFAAIPAGDVTFTIETNVAWSISLSNLDWLSIDPSKGVAKEGPQKVTLQASQNKAEAPRSGSLTLTAGSFTKTVQVSQEAAVVDPTFATNDLVDQKVEFAATEVSPKTFGVSSNKDWTATLSGLDWATVTPLSGDKGRVATISITPKAANTGAKREGTISFAYGAAQPFVVKVEQAAFVPEISVAPASLEAAADGAIANPVVKVTANAAWTASSDQSFITLDKASGAAGETSVTISVAANTVTQARTAKVTFVNGEAKAELAISQAAKPEETLELSASELSFVKAGEAKSVSVTSNAAWSVASSESWLTVAPASGSGNGTLTLTAAANEGAERTATVTVTAGALSKTVAVSQEGEDVAPFEKVVWCADDQEWNMANNPEFPGPHTGATGYVATAEKHGTGILKPMEGGDKGAYLEFVPKTAADFSTNTKGKFIFVAAGSSGSFGTKGGDLGFRQLFTDDAILFHVPSGKIAAGKTICFDFSFLGTNACAKLWAAEIKIGDEWKMFHTYQANGDVDGVNETSTGTSAPDAPANVILLSPQRTNSHYDCTYSVTADIPAGELQIRLRLVDHSLRITGSVSASDPTTDSTTRFVGWGDQEKRYLKDGHGPTIYVK